MVPMTFEKRTYNLGLQTKCTIVRILTAEFTVATTVLC